MKKNYSSTTPATPNGRYCYDGKAYNSTNDTCQAQSRSDYPVGSLTHSAARRSDGTLLSQTEFTNIDPLGRVLASRQTTDGLAAMNFAYQYAVGGALSGIQYPSGRWVTYTINGANRASAVRNGQSGSNYYMQNVQYKPSGAFSSATVGLDTANQWAETREYNSLLQARNLRLVKGAQTVLGLDWIYSANSQYNSSQDMYEETGSDNNGNLRMEKLAHTVGTPFSVDRSFGYNAANRLGSFSEPSKSQTFGYDAFGNLWQTAASGVPALRPNGSSWYLMANGSVSNRLANTAYDAAGHQTQLSLTPGTTASYDAEGRVSRVELNSNPVATYDYDADGRRVKKTVGATTTHYVYSADGQLMAEYGGTPASVGTRYLVSDHLGSTRLILDAQGNCAERIDYAPYGAQLTRSGQPCYTSSTSGLPLFTGQIRDGESTAGTDTGLDYFNARYFWATLGRFSSPDAPLIDQWEQDPQSWNLYSYVRNNPLRFSDPDGRKCVNGVDDQSGNQCVDVVEKMPKLKEEPSGLSPLDQLIYGAVFGHHGLPEWSKIAKDTTAYRFFSKWFTGPLQNPQANYYDALHRSLNQAARKVVGDFLQSVGKTSLSQLTKEEVKLLARQLLDSNAPGVQQFMTRLERLNPGSVGRLGSLINSIDIGSGFVFLVPGQQQLMNYQKCGLSACGGSGRMF